MVPLAAKVIFDGIVITVLATIRNEIRIAINLEKHFFTFKKTPP